MSESFHALVCRAVVCSCVVVCTVAPAAEPSASPDFRRDVRPILSQKCFRCHGPARKGRRGKLRLDDRAAAERVLRPGRSGEPSALIARITSDDPDELMPPPDSKTVLQPREIATLRRWIAAGAPYAGHWSFESLRPVPAPAVEARDGPRGAIDRFVFARLGHAGLAPSPEASRERLIRRVTFDLTGLPPTLEEIDAFLADDRSDAYEHLVDGLLARAAYGERMASDWLDVARYSDTFGYQVDRDRFVWPWRDWVVRAFNDNLPWDRFITWQLAGDLLPEATDEQILATTFQRLHPQKVEGGSTPEEFRVEYVADRVHTFGTAFLGLALECARCHEHKFDPISQEDYYRLFAFFDDIDEAGLYSFFTSSVPTPTLLLPDDRQRAAIADIERRVVEQEAALDARKAERRTAFVAWLEARPSEASMPGRVKHLDFETDVKAPNESIAGPRGRAVRLTGDDGVGTGVGNFARFQPFSVALWMRTPDVKERAVIFHRSRAWTDAASRGYQLLIEDGKLSASLIHFWPGNAIRVRTRAAIPTERWTHVTIAYDGSSRADGLRIFVDGRPAATEVIRDNLYKNITGGGGDHITIGQRFRDRGFTGGGVDEFEVFDRELAPLEAAQLHDRKSLETLLRKPSSELTVDERDHLFAYWLHAVDSAWAESLAALRKVREERSRAVDGVREIMVMRDRLEPRQAYVLGRGAYDARTDPVEPGTPASLPPFPQSAPRNRLGLARWLTDPSHPLTARVTVNRVWQMLFGDGLARTPEDLGSQGEPPTHPDLLDWLAHDFAANGWDVKRLLKQVVTSATYRQSSVASEALRARDPDNRLLARGPSYRLPAEMIRDNALAVSGLLARKVGGKPARPYEVTESFKPVGRDRGEGLYRRSLYTFWKRTAPAPAMMALDASKRDVCSVRRERTASPLQALVLLNGPQYIEAARVLGQRLLEKHGDDVDALVIETFRTLTSRRPRPEEIDVLRRLWSEQLAHFEAHAEQAEKLLATGDAPRNKDLRAARLAAAGVLASALMNFDECVVKR